ncbi:hypothetical protein XYCOK13_35620 [Xylanibacillus composti]|uniref:Glycosyltransferase 2-like domain-containing protein n=1 Tax=Xylanibacillus composti TaxID=1572762 RepID=A0A8J4H4D3_9BACL|nr:hypothetical protein XYCOK13_35620 [Xylanibacillus composti]
MVTVSLCMIVKNEEDTLSRCLDTIADLVDEINIVDTGSTDSTVEIARQYTDRVITMHGMTASPMRAMLPFNTQPKTISSIWTQTTSCWKRIGRNSGS